MLIRVVKNVGIFEIDNAEAAGFDIISDVAFIRVAMSHAKGFQFIEQGFLFSFGQLLDDLAAIGGDQIEILRPGLQQAGHKRAVALFEVFQHRDLVIVTSSGVMTFEGFADPSVIGDVHQRPARILSLFHGSIVNQLK